MAGKKTEKKSTTATPEINPVPEMEFVRPDYCTEKTIDCKVCNKAKTADDFEECKWYYDSVHSDGLCDCTGKMIEPHYHIKYTAIERSTGNTFSFQNKHDRDNYLKHENENDTLICDVKIGLSLFDDRPSDKTKKDIFKTFKILMENNNRIDEYSDILNSRDDIILMERIRGAIGEIENPQQAPGKTGKPQDDRTIAKKLNWTQSADTLKSVLKELEKDKYIKCGSIEKIMSGDKLPEISKVKDGSKEKILFYIFFAMHELELITEFIGYNESSGKEYLYSEGFQDIFSTGLNRSNREKYLPYDDAGKLQPIYKELYEEIQRTIKAAIK